jgi:hypothetical protein
VLLPLLELGDRLRAAPVRELAEAAQQQRRPGEPLAMVGLLKPSLHYYGRQVVLYEGAEPADLVNLADRLARERRPGLNPQPAATGRSVLVVIDRGTAQLPYWQALNPQALAARGPYALWRLDRTDLERRAGALRNLGVAATWQEPRPERY